MIVYRIGQYQYFGRLRCMAALLFGVMYSPSGSISVMAIGEYTCKTIVWPDVSKLSIALAVSRRALAAELCSANGKAPGRMCNSRGLRPFRMSA